MVKNSRVVLYFHTKWMQNCTLDVTHKDWKTLLKAGGSIRTALCGLLHLWDCMLWHKLVWSYSKLIRLSFYGSACVKLWSSWKYLECQCISWVDALQRRSAEIQYDKLLGFAVRNICISVYKRAYNALQKVVRPIWTFSYFVILPPSLCFIGFPCDCPRKNIVQLWGSFPEIIF